MSPWPGPRAAPQTLVPDEVPSLGLELAVVREARAGGLWTGYQGQGVMAVYVSGADTLAGVWALRYQDNSQAKADSIGPRTGSRGCRARGCSAAAA